MKKKILRLFLCITMSAMVLTFGACGSKDGSSAEENVEDTKEEDTEEPEEDADDSADAADDAAEADDDAADDAAQADASETDAADDSEDADAAGYAMFDSVAEFAASDLIQDQLTSMKESLVEAGMDINITGEDNKLIYTFSYLEIEKMDGMAEAIEEQLTTQADTFKSVAKSIKAAVDVEDPVVVVTYVDANEEVIYSQEFPAE